MTVSYSPLQGLGQKVTNAFNKPPRAILKMDRNTWEKESRPYLWGHSPSGQ